MKVEILFPEVCNLYGDLQNVYYLRRCCPELEIVETDLHSKPRFLTEDVALVYMGSTTEQGLRLSADALRPYAAEIAAKVDGGQLLLLRRQLAAHTVAGGGGSLQQIPSLLLHPLRLLPLFIEVVQQVGKAVIALRLRVGAILGNRAVGKVRQRPVPFDKRRCKGVFMHSPLPPGEHFPQGAPLRYGSVGAAAGADCQLPRHQRGYGGEGVQQPAVQRRVRRGGFLPAAPLTGR